MPDRDDRFGGDGRSTLVRTYLLPLAVLVVVVAVVSVLVLTQVLTGDQPRMTPERTSTTPPTVEIMPGSGG